MRGGHTIAQHVGRSDASLPKIVTTPLYATRRGKAYPHTHSTFFNILQATSVIKSTLSDPANRSGLEAVMRGVMKQYVAEKTFNRVVGFGYRQREKPNSIHFGRPRPYRVEMTKIRVIIVYDAKMHHRFRVKTAFPVQ